MPIIHHPIIGVLLAAGRSSRMQHFKPLIPWPPQQSSSSIAPHGTVLSASFNVIAPHVSSMFVVTGHRQFEIFRALAPHCFTAVFSPSDAPMITSIRAAISASLKLNPSHVFLHLADHPAVAPATISQIINGARDLPDRAIIPTFKNSGGHPILLPAALCNSILSPVADVGLRDFLHSKSDLMHRLPVDDPGILIDLDTPDDYLRARSS
ncbi:MAG TPA: nucleotidyltransferase family protein [Phycisphaerales bacterium]|nr:nucleotidyltransferase family protein [Phycisphaerales bacterium]